MKSSKNTKAGSVYPFLDARTPMANSPLLPIKITVSLRSGQFRIGLKLYATRDIYDKAVSGRGTVAREAKTLKKELDDYLVRANDILERFPNADRKLFTNLFKSEADLKGTGKTDMLPLFQSKIDELTEEDRAGSIAFYLSAISAFTRFRKAFFLEDITEDYLKAFRSWYIGQGNSNSTAQIHLRCLRHIFNRAIKKGYISSGLYPFKDYAIGTSSKSKNVVYPEKLKALWEYEPTSYGQKRAKDYFFFLYLTNGMNLKDALNLKGANLKGDMISFIRAKTSKTKADTTPVIAHLHPEAKKIIQKWGTLDTTDYLFPLFRGMTTDIERSKAKNVFGRNINRDLRVIGKNLGMTSHLTLNLARHTFATRLKLDGVPTSFISDALGHTNSRTTEYYLKSIPDDKYRVMSNTLLEF